MGRPCALLPALSILAVWSNHWHHLFVASARLVRQGSFVVTETTWGPLFWIHTAYCYAFLVAGTMLLLHGLVRAPVVYRGQARALLFAVFVPWAVNVAYDVGLRPWPHLDPTPFAFAVSAASFAWGLFRFGLLDLVPVARAIVGPKAIEAIGQRSAAVLQGWPELAPLPLGVIREGGVGESGAGRASGGTRGATSSATTTRTTAG